MLSIEAYNGGLWVQGQTPGSGSQGESPLNMIQRIYQEFLLKINYTVSKNVPRLTSHNLDIHNPITILFGRNVTGKVRNHMMLCFPTSPV